MLVYNIIYFKTTNATLSQHSAAQGSTAQLSAAQH